MLTIRCAFLPCVCSVRSGTGEHDIPCLDPPFLFLDCPLCRLGHITGVHLSSWHSSLVCMSRGRLSNRSDHSLFLGPLPHSHPRTPSLPPPALNPASYSHPLHRPHPPHPRGYAFTLQVQSATAPGGLPKTTPAFSISVTKVTPGFRSDKPSVVPAKPVTVDSMQCLIQTMASPSGPVIQR